MLVIISDLHLTDGTTGKTVAADAFERFRGNLQELAYFASFRGEELGSYQPVTRLDVVLLGDVVDQVRSTRWTDEREGQPGFARPWSRLDDAAERAALVAKLERITDDILAQNEASFAHFRRLAGERPVALPPATGSGFPARNVRRVPVETHVHYMAGNHDWFMNLPGDDFEGLRTKVTQAMGLSNPPGPYPHDPAESEAISEVFAQHRVFARHGDIYDPFNYDKIGRHVASLGDAIVVELMNSFPDMVREQMAGDLPPTFLAGMDEMGNVRPTLLVPVWIQGLLKRHNVRKVHGDEVKRIWNEIANQTLDSPFIREKDTRSPFDTVDLLETTLRFSRLASFHSLAELVSWVQQKLWGGDVSFAKFALEEEAFEDQSAHYFVYGHTHHAEVVPLYTETRPDGNELAQMYFNSGTWHPVHDITIAKPREQTFIQTKVLTYLAFYKDNERKGRQYETWTGTLFDR